jgi:hypothetical protein
VLEHRARVLDGEVEHVGDRAAAEAHLERLAVEALPLADVARHEDVGEEVHLDLHEPVALARLAAPPLTLNEKRPARSRGSSPRASREQLAHGREQPRCTVAGFERGVRPDRALVDVDHLVEVLEPGDAVVRAGTTRAR